MVSCKSIVGNCNYFSAFGTMSQTTKKSACTSVCKNDLMLVVDLLNVTGKSKMRAVCRDYGSSEWEDSYLPPI